MTPDVVTIIAVTCAGIGVVSTVVYFVFKWKELQAMRELGETLKRRK